MVRTHWETLKEVPEPPSTDLPTIVLVEDDLDDEQLVHRALRRAGFPNPLAVERKVEGSIDRILQLGQKGSLALILLDLKLGSGNGIDVLRAVRAHPATELAPVVVCSSSYDLLEIEECYRAGANGFVHKPVDCLQYQDCVEELLRYWLGLNQSVIWVPGKLS